MQIWVSFQTVSTASNNFEALKQGKLTPEQVTEIKQNLGSISRLIFPAANFLFVSFVSFVVKFSPR